jgi:hypothetical protein
MIESVRVKIESERKDDLFKNHLQSIEHYLNLHQVPVSTKKRILIVYQSCINTDNIEDIYYYPIEQIVNTLFNFI